MATKWPCDKAIACPCSENPLGNFSSEAPDPFTFFSRIFFPNPTQINDPPQVFITPSCGAACESTVSQQDADSCALREATLCVQPPAPPAPDDPTLFGNRAISCQAECPEGPPFILNIAPGTYLARTQELADAIARSFCNTDVIAFRHCDMPPMPPPQGACPHITTQTASPINANDGDNVTMTVNYTYNSAMMLMFVWFKDGIATYTTPSSSLTLNAVGAGDAGDYILGIYASGCFPVFSSPITLNVTSSCPPEVGADPPSTLDIMAPVEWETVTAGEADLLTLVSADGPSNPTALRYFTPPNGLDHAPGIYAELYQAGYFNADAAGFCGGGTPSAGDLNVVNLVNEEYNFDSPYPAAQTNLNNGTFREYHGFAPPGPASYFNYYLSPCFPDQATVAADIHAIIPLGPCITNNPYPPDEISSFKHSNMGGKFTLYFVESFPGPNPVQEQFSLKILQLEGQIPQPRKLQIDDFATVAAQFTDPAIGLNWSGNIDTRTTYTSTVLLWSQPASGGFGGATLEWYNGHPTSANGYGWKLKIFGAGPTLVWQGIAGTELTPITRFYKDSTATVLGPDCITCSDASTTSWSPP